MSQNVKLTILLRTQNTEKELEKFRGRADEIVVVDHASRDGTRAVAAAMGAKVVPYGEGAYSYGRALNLGVPVCEGEWILVASQHFEPMHEGFWKDLVRDLEKLPDHVVACQSPIFLTPKARGGSQGITFIGPEDLEFVPWALYGNTCCAYRRERLLKQPFDESLPTAEDVEWCYRAVRGGGRICIDHRLPVIYRNRAPLARYWRRGRTDLPAVAGIYGIELKTSIFSGVGFLVKDAAQFLRGGLPPWLWIRLFVKRLAELSLRLW